MHFMKGEIFMNQEIIKVDLLEADSETDILRFYVSYKPIDVNLNSSACQGSLKNIFAILLRRLIHSDIKLELSVNQEYKRAMYIEVCTEYIKDLNRELAEVTEELRRELSQ